MKLHQLSLCFVLALLALFQLNAGESPAPTDANQLRLSLKLRDGSLIIGTMKDDELPVDSEAIGTIKLPLSRVTNIKFGDAGKPDTIALNNGDKLKGEIRLAKISVEAVFGRVSVPKAVLAEIQVKSAGGRAARLEWETLPFFQDSDWPGDRGQRAEIQDDGSIIFHGQPVLSKETYSLPLTIEYDVTIPEPSENDGGFTLAAFQPDQPTDMDVRDAVMFYLSTQNRGGATVVCHFLKGSKRGKKIWGDRPVAITPGKTYHCRLTMNADEVLFDVGEQSFQLVGVKVPYDKFKIWLWGWRTTDAWRVSNFTVH